ncbi:helix-turn-helix transcriptional regulator [Paenibacillus gorillae]|uniref:helix-turn-helix transcriptional regulator n=1 Tax=Paenibacillus gorillae TaxID=1243662 RepID=UPI0004ADBB41|nr:helix-turn-helix transcriptional regulator [Paenibacillus gorillae]
MSSDISYTTEELARLLKISKLKVYDLIKKGELPSYRVGKQMRVDADDLEAYKLRSKGGIAASAEPAGRSEPASSSHSFVNGPRTIVVTGQDVSLDILAKHLERDCPGLRPLRAYSGSLDSLIAMYRGEADIVSTHLLDGDSGQYNLPYIRKLLIGSPFLVVNLLSRSAGLYVQKGNPLAIRGWDDFKRSDLRLVNREIGSGARVLLDEQLRLRDIQGNQINGYSNEQSNHLGVAAQVAAGGADVGVGIEKAASIVGNVEFIPLIQERYDLVLLKKPENSPWIEALLRILTSDAFQRELGAISGYDLSLTGQILMET